MARLVIPSHMSGEQYITKAALIADPKLEVRVFPGTKMLLDEYRTDAARRGQSLAELYNSRHRTAFANDAEVRNAIDQKQKENLKSMVEFFQKDIINPARVSRDENENLKPVTRGSTQAVRELYRDPARNAQQVIRNGLEVDPETQRGIEEFYFSKGLKKDEKYAIFWGRKSGEMTGAGPALDTNEIMLAQMMVVIRRKDPLRKLILIGDPVALPLEVDDMKAPSFDIDLVRYWDSGFPNATGVLAQMGFIRLIIDWNPDSVSIGTNSGILELPHLMGMKTVYLENVHDHARKGLRWQLLAANYRVPTADELNVLERKLKSEQASPNPNTGKIDALNRDIAKINNKKIDVLNQIRPGLQRFSTTTSTEFRASRKALFDEVGAWLDRQSPPEPRNPVAAHDTFLDLLTSAANTPEGDRESLAGSGQSSPWWNLQHKAESAWAPIRTSRQPFSGSPGKRADALAAMSGAMRLHGFTTAQKEQFWNTFNYTYVNDREMPAVSAPDVRAGYRAWLQETDEIWAYVKGRQFPGS